MITEAEKHIGDLIFEKFNGFRVFQILLSASSFILANKFLNNF